MKTLLIDFHIHTVYSQEASAHLSIKDTLDYYQTLGNRAGQRVIIRINDHDNFYGGVKAVEYYIEHKDKYPNIFVVPGIEFNVNLGSALKFRKTNFVPSPEFPDEDDKYDFIFKKAHIGAAPIIKDRESFEKWKNSKDLQVYSKLAKMCLDRTINQKYYFDSMAIPLHHSEREALSNTGDQIIASKNLIRKKFGVIIPFSYLEPCVVDGKTHLEIVNKFVDLATKYMKENYEPYQELSSKQIRNQLINFFVNEKCLDMRIVFSTDEILLKALGLINRKYNINIPKEFIDDCFDDKMSKQNKIAMFYHNMTDILKKYSRVCKEYKRERIYAEIKQITRALFGKSNDNMFYTFGGLRRIHLDEMCNMVTQAGGLIDLEHPDKGFEIHQDKKIPVEILKKLDYSVLRTSDKNDVMEKLEKGEDLQLDELLGQDCKLDSTGLVRLQLLRLGMHESGINLNNDMMGVELTRYTMKNTRHLNAVLKVMENNRLLVSSGSDKHFNILDYYMFAAKDKEYRKDYYKNERVIDEDYLKNLYANVKDDKDIKYDLNAYAIPTQTTNTARIFNYKTLELERHEVYSNIVKQTAFCDAVLGKEIDFTKSNMIDVHLGALVKDDNEFAKEEDAYSDLMYIIYNDIHSTSVKMGIENFTKEQINEVKEYSKQKVLELKKENKEISDEEFSSFLGNMIVKNRTKLKEILDENLLNK